MIIDAEFKETKHILDADFGEVCNIGYDKGYINGENNGYTNGLEEGKEKAKSDFWDSFQDNGNRTNYIYAFAGGQNAENPWRKLLFENGFLPKYPIKPLDGGSMFSQMDANIDLTEFIEKNNLDWDFTKLTNANFMFQYSKFTRIPKIYNAKNGLASVFGSCDLLETIDEVGTGSTSSTSWNSAFSGCTALKNIKIKGTISCSTFDVKSSVNLTHESLMSIINALADKSTGV